LNFAMAKTNNKNLAVSALLYKCPPSDHFTCFMSSLVCRLCYVQCRTQIFHVDIFLFPVFMSQVYFRFKVICKVASSLKGHLLVISY
jgi:hypothetical protein